MKVLCPVFQLQNLRVSFINLSSNLHPHADCSLVGELKKAHVPKEPNARKFTKDRACSHEHAPTVAQGYLIPFRVQPIGVIDGNIS